MMSRSLWLMPLLLLGAACAAWAQDGVTFAAMGDGPYHDKDWNRLRDQISRENKDLKAKFIIHVGDIASGTPVLPESRYERVSEYLRASRLPVFIIPGDNEWNDLLNPQQGWANWTKHFSAFETNFELPWPVTRSESLPEQFAFVADGVLFVGVNVVGGRVHDAAEWRERHAQAALWISEQFELHRDAVRAAVVFGHAHPKENHEDFVAPFAECAATFAKPVLYLHGDGHVWEKQRHWRAPNLMRVQVDQIGKGPPVRVTVTQDADEPFRFDRQLEFRNTELYEPMNKRIQRRDGFGRLSRPGVR